MDVSEVLTDALERVRDQIPDLVQGLDESGLTWRPDPGANPIGWLIWHLTRVQDDHIASAADTSQVWLDQGWYERFGLPYPPEAFGYGHSSEEVGLFRGVSAELLAGYQAAVANRSIRFVAGLGADDLDRVVDERWDPPVTLGARLVSIVGEIHAHTAQAAYVRGMWERRRG